ncbi:hypothetical protein SAMN04488498_1012 [Mesorhizobium albiziae]|uniref:Uncharacterized protein n=1 Tax=Neomesorhizobium albiziae TaxID=335020 RepID=A0A1I3UTE7_9HYPH|nr:hypothetical protein SAMN04488498_1012 [Mesorhizobium albiziae]
MKSGLVPPPESWVSTNWLLWVTHHHDILQRASVEAELYEALSRDRSDDSGSSPRPQKQLPEDGDIKGKARDVKLFIAEIHENGALAGRPALEYPSISSEGV